MSVTDQDALSPERAANLAENPYAGQGAVLLDIGGHVGTVVLHLPAAYEGAEVEYRREGEPPPTHHHHHSRNHPHAHAHAPHVTVVGRPAGDRLADTAVFPVLVAGRYVLTLPDESELPVVVADGAVTELRWPRS